MTRSQPPAWLLLSDDVEHRIFELLNYFPDSAAAACVSKAWRKTWKDTDDKRRGLREPTVLVPDFALGGYALFAAHPSGSWFAFSDGNGTLRIVDSSMRTIKLLGDVGDILRMAQVQ